VKVNRGSLVALTVLGACAGCAEPPEEGDCGSGEVELALDPDRPGFPELVDGAEVPVFIPPQTGVFTELDVHMHGIAVDDVLELRVTVDPPTGDLLASQMYQGAALPLFCLPGGDILLRRMPVAFADAVVLDELEGVQAELALTVFTRTGDHDRTWNVVLRVSEF
jgi:hypothetical protein